LVPGTPVTIHNTSILNRSLISRMQQRKRKEGRKKERMNERKRERKE
jgi:hypothetical protein